MYNQRWQLTHPGYSVLDDDDSGERKALIPFYRKVGRLSVDRGGSGAHRARRHRRRARGGARGRPRRPRPARPTRCPARDPHPDSRAEVRPDSDGCATRRPSSSNSCSHGDAPSSRPSPRAADPPSPAASSTPSTRDCPSRSPLARSGSAARSPTTSPGRRRCTVSCREVGSGKTLVAPERCSPSSTREARRHCCSDRGPGPTASPLDHSHARRPRRRPPRRRRPKHAGGLLTGSMSTAGARRPAQRIASGQAGIVIGTHALLQDNVQFADLALVVVDEQHRFGVEQRDALRAKGPSRRTSWS